MHDLPDEFFYFPQESSVQYSQTPQGEPVVERMIEGKPDFWLTQSMPRVKTQRKVILANWSINYLNWFRDIKPIALKIMELVAAGFQFYVSINFTSMSIEEDVNLIPLPKNPDDLYGKLDLLASLAQATHPDLLIDAAVKKYSLSRDELLILDAYWVDYLTREDSKLTSYGIYNIAGPPRDDLLLISARPITTIYHNIFSEKHNIYLKKLRKCFPKASTTIQYTSVTFDSRDTATDFTTALCGGESYTLHDVTFSPEHLENLTTLHLDCEKITNAGLVSELLHQCTKLKRLVLGGLSIELTKELRRTIADDVCPRLKDIKIEYSHVSAASLSRLLRKFPYLEALSLKSSQLDGEVRVLIASTPHLKILDFATSFVSYAHSVQHIPNILEEMTMDVHHINILQQLPPNLKRLSLNGLYDASIQPFVNSLRERGIYVYWPPEYELKYNKQSTQPVQGIPPQKTSKMHLGSIQRPPNAKKTLDADTSYNPSKTLHAKSIFYSADRQAAPKVNNYRLDIYHKIKINEESGDLDHAFGMIKDGDLNLIACEIAQSANDVYAQVKQARSKKYHYYYGKQTLSLNHEWQALASLAPNEKILSYHLNRDVDVEIHYSERDNLYYIRTKIPCTAQTIDIDFALEVPKEKPALAPDIQALVNEFLKFGRGKLDIINPEIANGHDYLSAIREQKKGSCRHRAFAFKAAMQSLHSDIPVRIVNNDCHAFVELNIAGQWIACDLGGYPTELNIDDSNKPLPLASKSTAHKVPQQASQAESKKPPRIEAKLPEAQYFKTWGKEAASGETVLSYCKKLMEPGSNSKRLIKLSSNEDVHAMQWIMQDYARQTSHPIFYVDSPDDLICKAPWIERTETEDGIKGELKAGPGGRLYRFLTDNPHNEHRSLIINYERFTAEDIVRFNTLIDKERMIDGILIPPSVTLIGLINTHSPEYYSGADFHSRFDSKRLAPSTQALTDAMAPHLMTVPELSTTDTEVAHITLYHSNNWKSLLLGKWIINDQSLTFEEGKLQQALKEKRPIVIHQGLWENREFRHFWEQAKLHGRIEHSGGTVIIPDDLQLLRDERYDWESIKQNIHCEPEPLAGAEILNPGRLNRFFNHYQCDNAHQTLHRLTGLIAAQAEGEDKHLHVCLSRELSEDQWARLGDECKQHKVQLIVHPGPGLGFPETMGMAYETTVPTTSSWDKSAKHSNTQIIASTDLDATVALLTQDDANCYVLDASACTAADLLSHVQANFDQHTLSFQFLETQRALITALDRGKIVILKGHFSAELRDDLAAFLAKRAQDAPGKLIIVGNDASLFSFMEVHTHEVSLDDKHICLQHAGFLDAEIESLGDDIFSKEPLCRLQARLTHQRIYPGAPSEEAWLGIAELNGAPPLKPLCKTDDTKSLAETFNQERLEEIFTSLDHAPYAYITGLTGVGKTTFIERHIQTNPRVNFFNGVASTKDWASSQSLDQLQVLFIDEANLCHRQWSEFEGLFHKPPSILLDGVYYPLTKQHKVIFAGNPLSYGDERKSAAIFARHGNAVLFDPLPLASIYEDILKPVFANTALAAQTWEICQPILTAYRFLCERSLDEVLLSPRELQMMALLVLSHHEQQPSSDCVDAANYYAYHLAKNWVPEDAHSEFLALDSVISAQQIKLHQKSILFNSPDFLVTDSRRQILEQLTDLLALRELRQERVERFNTAQLFGGLGGIVLTGEPGIGKSEMLIALLRQHNYKEKRFLETPTVEGSELHDDKKIFYRMPVSLALSLKQAMLLQAFNEGAVVIVDELNSSPMLESWFNDLLMGKHPISKKPPLNPGFCLIATQNPPNMAGRRVASPAFKHRTLQETVAPYSHKEMCDILVNEGLTPRKAKRLVTAYEDHRHYARDKRLKPEPSFRDVLKAAKLVRKRMFAVVLNELDDTITKLSDEKIKRSVTALRDLIVKLKANKEKQLTPYIILSNELLKASPEQRPALLVEFEKKAMEARNRPTSLWKKLGLALLLVSAVVALATGLLITTTGLGAILGITLAAGSVALLTTGLGMFSHHQQTRLSRTMLDLHQVVGSAVP
jgi:MoxR-like ATPase